MKHALPLLACVLGLAACADPVVKSKRLVTVDGNELQISSGTLNTGNFVSVDNVKMTWVGKFTGGKEKWGMRKKLFTKLYTTEVARICNSPFYARRLGPVYNMFDSDETLGGAAPALGLSVTMLAGLAAEASTKVENIPTGVYFEFQCPEK